MRKNHHKTTENTGSVYLIKKKKRERNQIHKLMSKKNKRKKNE